jgi:hypothetical protein
MTRRHSAAGCPAFAACIGLACALSGATTWAEDPGQSPPDTARRLQLTLTEMELERIIRSYQRRHGLALEGTLEEIAVKAPPVPLRMRDPTRDIWGGVAAPFWALLHPTQSWRILVPVPPKRPPPSAPDQEQ